MKCNQSSRSNLLASASFPFPFGFLLQNKIIPGMEPPDPHPPHTLSPTVVTRSNRSQGFERPFFARRLATQANQSWLAFWTMQGLFKQDLHRDMGGSVGRNHKQTQTRLLRGVSSQERRSSCIWDMDFYKSKAGPLEDKHSSNQASNADRRRGTTDPVLPRLWATWAGSWIWWVRKCRKHSFRDVSSLIFHHFYVSLLSTVPKPYYRGPLYKPSLKSSGQGLKISCKVATAAWRVRCVEA